MSDNAKTGDSTAGWYCKDCGTKMSHHQAEYDEDCHCGGSFVSLPGLADHDAAPAAAVREQCIEACKSVREEFDHALGVSAAGVRKIDMAIERIRALPMPDADRRSNIAKALIDARTDGINYETGVWREMILADPRVRRVWEEIRVSPTQEFSADDAASLVAILCQRDVAHDERIRSEARLEEARWWRNYFPGKPEYDRRIAELEAARSRSQKP